MTIEERILISFDDIAGIVLECSKCKARVTRSPDQPGQIPHVCGQCQAVFLANMVHADTITHQLIAAISAYRLGVSDGFVLKLEINGRDLRQADKQ